jgi:NADH:ubiquinone oxidoreductase subunit H
MNLHGPPTVGPCLLQPLADGFKFFVKETVLPSTAGKDTIMRDRISPLDAWRG